MNSMGDQNGLRQVDGSVAPTIDYLFYVSKTHNLPAAFFRSILKFLNPSIVMCENMYLIVELGSEKKFMELRKSGISPAEAQYWSNLFLVSGSFCSSSYEEDLQIAEMISETWRRSLSAFPSASRNVRVIEDQKEGEVFLVTSDWRPSDQVE